MNRRFSNLAICILGSAFLASPVNQIKAEASPSIVESGTQRMNEIVNRYRVDQQQPQQELQNPTLISQNFVDAQNRIVNQFRQQSNEIVNQYREGVKKRQQQRLQNSTTGYQIYNPNQARQNSSQTSPYYTQGFKDIVDIFSQQSNEIVNQYRRDSKNRVSNPSPNIGIGGLQQQRYVIDRNWVRSY